MNRRAKIIITGFFISLLIGLCMARFERSVTAQEAHRHAHAPASAKGLQSLIAASAEHLARGRMLYAEHCASCHGAEGQAKTEKAAAMKVKPANLTMLHDRTEGEIYWVITNGIKPSGMPGFQAKMSETERWQTALHVQRLSREHAQPGAAHQHQEKATTPQQAPPMKQDANQQHQHHAQTKSSDTRQGATAAHPGHSTMNMMTTVTGGPYRSMRAIGSGTALQPASTPLAAWMFMPGEWMLMLHGDVKLGLNHQGGPRGVGKFESQNWAMLMAERNVGPGRLMLRGMVSAEPLTAPHGGFPLLFQSGETYRRRPVIDAQHPHDLFMELAASYTIPFSENVSFQLYGGPVGEPALGPVAFMHRASALENPSAPLGHHFHDSTHITAGVLTAALTAGHFKFEGSLFNGREPDENRATIDLDRLDSYSFRTWFMPTENWAAQFSYGRLRDPEIFEPGVVKRMTASISYNRPLTDGNWASTIVWGRTDKQESDRNSYLFESTLFFRRKNHLYTRIELSDREGLLADNIFGRPGLIRLPMLPLDNSHIHLPEEFERAFRVAAFTFGGVRDFVENEKVRIGLGADVTFYNKPAELDPIYGRRPTSFHVFLRFRPGLMR